MDSPLDALKLNYSSQLSGKQRTKAVDDSWPERF